MFKASSGQSPEVRGEKPHMSARRQAHPSGHGRWRRPGLPHPQHPLSAERGLEVLACFTPERRVLVNNEIAIKLGMTQATTHLYTSTLLALGYLEQDSSRSYRLTPPTAELGMSTQSSTSLREQVHSYLEELRTQSSYTASVAILDGIEILFIDRARSFRRGQDKIDLGLLPGSRLPAHCTAMGKLLLAHMPKHELRRALSEMRMEMRAPNTVTNRSVLRRELQQIREDGMAVNNQELAAGHHAVAVPIRAYSSQEVVAALGVGAHRTMISLEELVDDLMPHLLVAADRISAHLGQ
jgi:IclR family pca regulon transcriptional regulator